MTAALFTWQAGAVLALGGSLFLWRAGPIPSALAAWRTRLGWGFAGSCLLAWGAGFAVLIEDGSRIVGHRLAWNAPELAVLVTRTRVGQVWAIKQTVLSVLLIGAGVAVWRRRDYGIGCAALAAIFLAVGMWSGHGGATPPLAINLPLHALHTLVAASWLGGLPLWMSLVWHADTATRDYLGLAIARFSTFAGAMIAILLASGSVIAWQQFAHWPALFGTRAGGVLAIKLCLLGVALAMAWRLRQRFLRRLAAPHDTALRVAALRLIGCELTAACGVFIAALDLARMTPGAHQVITWWLPFRIAPDAALAEPMARWLTTLGVALALSALLAVGWRRYRLALVGVIAGFSILCYALAVPAFPDTYRRSAVAYTADSIKHGAGLFATHCTGCHGPGARGGPISQDPVGRAVDLSEHTVLHTAGDMFWWISHGTPSRRMPGFAENLATMQRWDLINFLRAFADGHRGRILGPTVMLQQPWLGAPNFQFETNAGENGELKDFRERQPVLLVLASTPQAAARLKNLNEQAATLQAAGLKILVVNTRPCADAGFDNSAMSCVVHGGESIAQAYRLLTRTLTIPGSRNELFPARTDAEFLIDRFGYLRARSIPGVDGDGWATPDALVQALAVLAKEPKILESPDEHVH